MDTDLMTALRGADPAARLDLTQVDRGAQDLLRDGVVLTPRTGRNHERRPRKGRRALLAGGLALAIVGTGATAYAFLNRWYEGGSELTCAASWADLASGDPQRVTGGPPITHDPVADCQAYQELAGLPLINDPVAVRHKPEAYDTFVLPRGEVPSDLKPVPPASDRDQAIAQLQHSLDDYVDGGNSHCFDTEDGLAWAAGEMRRLGLDDIPVVKQENDHADGSCGTFGFYDDAVRFTPRNQALGPAVDGPVATGLRSQIAQVCVSLPDAEAITESLLAGEQGYHPTSAVLDESMPCTTVDLVLAGSGQVFLRGPSTAGR